MPIFSVKEQRQFLGLLFITALLFGVGLFSPMMTVSKFVIASHSYTLLGGIIDLLREGDWFLTLIIVVFTIIIPILKIYIMYKIVKNNDRNDEKLLSYINFMHQYGRWAMLDVFIIAILVSSVKLGGLASVDVEYGTYIFTVVVLLIFYINTQIIKKCSPPL